MNGSHHSQATSRARTSTDRDTVDLRCTCCQPWNRLVPRPDLGTLPDGRARYALCVFHQPEPTVYVATDHGYRQAPELALGPDGDVIGRDTAPAPDDRLSRSPGPLVGTEEHQGIEVDLSTDEFYF